MPKAIDWSVLSEYEKEDNTSQVKHLLALVMSVKLLTLEHKGEEYVRTN